MNKSFVGVALTLAFAVVLGLTPAISQEQKEEPTLYAASGRVTFKRYCASCHGKAADGNGMLATMLKVEPSDLRFLSPENEGEFPAKRVAEFIDGRRFVQAHGAREMPVWAKCCRLSCVLFQGRSRSMARNGPRAKSRSWCSTWRRSNWKRI